LTTWAHLDCATSPLVRSWHHTDVSR